MGAANFFQYIWPLSQNHRQAPKPNTMMLTTQMSGWMFLRNTAGYHKSIQARSTHRIEEHKIGYLAPRVPKSKIPKLTGDEST
jgi:hypothetical protein